MGLLEALADIAQREENEKCLRIALSGYSSSLSTRKITSTLD